MTHRNILMLVIIVAVVFIVYIGMATAGESVTEVSELYTISVSTDPANYGPQPSGGGTYEKGSTITVVASQYAMFPCPPDMACPMEVFPFFRWIEDGVTVSYNPSYSFVVNANRNLVADYNYDDSCPGDANGDNDVNILDITYVLNHWGEGAASFADVNYDGNVNVLDITYVLNHWGGCPVPPLYNV